MYLWLSRSVETWRQSELSLSRSFAPRSTTPPPPSPCHHHHHHHHHHHRHQHHHHPRPPSHLVRLSDRGIGESAIVFCVITPLLGHHRAASHSQSDSSHSQKRLSHLPPPSLHHCIGGQAITPLYNPPCFSAIHPPLNITNELQWVSRGDTKWQFLHEIHFHWMPCNFNSGNCNCRLDIIFHELDLSFISLLLFKDQITLLIIVLN